MRGTRRILIAVLAVVVVAGFGVWWFVLRDTSPAKLTLKSDTNSLSSQPNSPGGLAGTWKVVAGSGDEATVAGYRVQEKFAAGVAKVTAAGRTTDVTGSATVGGTTVSAASFDVDLTTLHSDRSQRDNTIRNRGLETDKFPKASFQLTAPIQLPQITNGKVFDVTATGDLTLHGVTKKVSVPLRAKQSGSSFAVQGSLPVVMADYSISPPNVGGFVSVDDNGAFEFLLNLAKA
jgi:polyisoprenoid-binding protein YceI